MSKIVIDERFLPIRRLISSWFVDDYKTIRGCYPSKVEQKNFGYVLNNIVRNFLRVADEQGQDKAADAARGVVNLYLLKASNRMMT